MLILISYSSVLRISFSTSIAITQTHLLSDYTTLIILSKKMAEIQASVKAIMVKPVQLSGTSSFLPVVYL